MGYGVDGSDVGLMDGMWGSGMGVGLRDGIWGSEMGCRAEGGTLSSGTEMWG